MYHGGNCALTLHASRGYCSRFIHALPVYMSVSNRMTVDWMGSALYIVGYQFGGEIEIRHHQHGHSPRPWMASGNLEAPACQISCSDYQSATTTCTLIVSTLFWSLPARWPTNPLLRCCQDGRESRARREVGRYGLPEAFQSPKSSLSSSLRTSCFPCTTFQTVGVLLSIARY